jgi:hypothetical protein
MDRKCNPYIFLSCRDTLEGDSVRNTKRMLCLVITMSFVISAVPALATQADTGHEGWDLVASDAWMDDMIAWARKQPKQYVDNGIEVPIDGTVYFLQNGFPSSRAESRVLNACGSGYTQEGGGDHSYLLIATGDANYPNATKRQEIIDEFDDVIWPTDTTVFGLGGYFAGGDNIWIDAADINGWGYQIMAHEFQHMIHNQQDGNEELWLNEGNSDLAIVLCYTGQASGVRSHIMAFEQSPDNDLTQFDNQGYDYGSSLAYVRTCGSITVATPPSTISSTIAQTVSGASPTR